MKRMRKRMRKRIMRKRRMEQMTTARKKKTKRNPAALIAMMLQTRIVKMWKMGMKKLKRKRTS